MQVTSDETTLTLILITHNKSEITIFRHIITSVFPILCINELLFQELPWEKGFLLLLCLLLFLCWFFVVVLVFVCLFFVSELQMSFCRNMERLIKFIKD